MDWKRVGCWLEMGWKWAGNGLEMVWKWFGNGLEMGWKWFGNGLEWCLYHFVFPPQLLKHIVLLRVQAFPAASADLKEQVHNALHGFGHFLTDLSQPFVEVYTRATERAAVTSMWRSFEEERFTFSIAASSAYSSMTSNS